MTRVGFRYALLVVSLSFPCVDAAAQTETWYEPYAAGATEQQNGHPAAALSLFRRAFARADDETNKARIALLAARSAAALGDRAEYLLWAGRAGSELSAEERARLDRMLPPEVVVGTRQRSRLKRWLGVGVGAIGAVALVGGAVATDLFLERGRGLETCIVKWGKTAEASCPEQFRSLYAAQDWAWAGAVVAVGAGVASAVLLVLDTTDQSGARSTRTPALRFACGPAPGAAGGLTLDCRGRF